MRIWNQNKYIHALRFAAESHKGQLIPGSDLPYIEHVVLVAMEIMSSIAAKSGVKKPDLAVSCALLHDTIEDTDATPAIIEKEFGQDVAAGVMALTKDKNLGSKEEQMKDSLTRIKMEPVEVWMVKLADRITNLRKPPAYWDKEKSIKYRLEAEKILDELGQSSDYLARRLEKKIEEFSDYC